MLRLLENVLANESGLLHLLFSATPVPLQFYLNRQMDEQHIGACEGAVAETKRVGLCMCIVASTIKASHCFYVTMAPAWEGIYVCPTTGLSCALPARGHYDVRMRRVRRYFLLHLRPRQTPISQVLFCRRWGFVYCV